MNQKAHNQIVSFIWSIADDVLRDVFVRGKYRYIILPPPERSFLLNLRSTERCWVKFETSPSYPNEFAIRS